MNLKAILNPWKVAAQLERENQRLRDCLEHEYRRNFDYMFHRMEYKRRQYAQIEAMNKHLMDNAVDLAIMNIPPLFVAQNTNGKTTGK